MRCFPGDRIPYDITVPTLDGQWTLTEHLPALIMAHDSTDPFSQALWTSDDSVVDFISKAPNSSNFLFITYDLDAAGQANAMRGRLRWAASQLGLGAAQAAARLDRLAFATLPVSGLSDVGANFLPYLLDHWRSPRKRLTATAGPGGDELLECVRADAAPTWLPGPPGGPMQLVFVGNGRGSRQDCSYADIVSRAQAAHASGALISAAAGGDVEMMDCRGGECALPLSIPAAMIPLHAATKLQEALAAAEAHGRDPVSVEFSAREGGGLFAAVDERGRLAETGWQAFPTLMHLGWAAQWLEYEAELRANLSKPALTVPVFKNAWLAGDHGIVAEVLMPPLEEQAAHDLLHLDFALGCPGTTDADCAIWDHVVQLFVCCDGGEGSGGSGGGGGSGAERPCDKCDSTVWLAAHRPEDPAEREWQLAARACGAPYLNEEVECGRELGRWITPFRRRVGRWLTDVTPLRPLLNGGQRCRFRLQTAPWGLPWRPSLTLRFSNSSRAGPQPTEVIPLFGGGTFDSAYNAQRPTLRFRTPNGTARALLEAVITGHGSDEENCAEFCVTSHTLLVNGAEHSVTFREAGTAWGCADRVREGIVPNEHGTWQYGRDGWCDGQQVRPWLADVTADLHAPDGPPNQVEYYGLYKGRSPQPQSTPGFIMMQSNLVVYGSKDGDTEEPGTAAR
ncbi:hypothetical protein WJX81_001912 [Elliptochloris bilobata]|uniref:Peptide-N-glycosidase F N-terminal domain-containing protein n=1 Tax=Elliptochloris bilobata TaxID=381761 RepID=A0AAW1QIR1_9CHLO